MLLIRGMRGLVGRSVQRQAHRPIHQALILRMEHIINVPLLGESITEGSIAKWNLKVGDKVQVDDIVALIETDKITVDVRSPYGGVITKCYGESADSVNVGEALFIVDEDGDRKSEQSESLSPSIDEVPPSFVPSLFMKQVVSSKRNYVPLIKFVGKRNNVSSMTPCKSSHSKNEFNVAQSIDDFPTFGRPMLLNDEIDAINSGGASLA